MLSLFTGQATPTREQLACSGGEVRSSTSRATPWPGVAFINPHGSGRLTIQRNPETGTVTIALAGRLTPESARLIGEVLRLMCLS